jgi:hypothetical protein
MERSRSFLVGSPVGKRETDRSGSPVGVVRVDPDRSYSGIGELLREYINEASREAWEKIRAKIDYTYENLGFALSALEAETHFGAEIKRRIEEGRKLLFKPNLVNILNIDPETHGPDRGSTACTEWPFVAALMRWFHDRLGIRYHQMALGEAATLMHGAAGYYSMLHPQGKRVTTEAAIEGRCGDFYGGWGFYFVRQYLRESLGAGGDDDPMKGYEESAAGRYVSPGHAGDRLMVYDLSRIFDDPAKGRDLVVPDGVNFKSITLHKAIVGGEPGKKEDLDAYPGCMLVNVPKLKVHAIALFTNVIKNLGIGLYPMQSTKEGSCRWDYSVPHNAVPGMKAGIPHQVWVPEMDPATKLPRMDSAGHFIVKKTGGMTATMIDIIQAVRREGIYMLHVVDGIEAVNLDHQGQFPGTKEKEGLVFAGLDPVATDLLCARYLFSNVPLAEASAGQSHDGNGGRFPQRVPVPAVVGDQIVTRTGYDCPLSRDICFSAAEKRGLGKRTYYVVGKDAVAERPLVSLQGHLGSVSGGEFSDLITRTLYFDVFKLPWDLQQTAFNYFAAVDQLTGSSLKKHFLEAFDEDGDGIVTYEEFGRNGIFGPILHWGGEGVSALGTDEFGYLKGPFNVRVSYLKYSEALWNPHGQDFLRGRFYGDVCVAAHRMSSLPLEAPDPFCPKLTWGKGKWPSFQFARHVYLGINLYGNQFPWKIGLPSLYAAAFLYTDKTQNEGRYSGKIRTRPNPEAVQNYFSSISGGRQKPLDFIFYIPAVYEQIAGARVPNVEVTTDASRIFTATFAGGKEIWGGFAR